VVEVRGEAVRAYSVAPDEVGLDAAPGESVPGGDPGQNADTARRILSGEAGPARDLAVLNAGAAIYAAAGSESLAEGVQRAQEAIGSGAAATTLERFVAATTELADGPAR
jgi:anthranilate phosphoribosyltransferase